MATNNAAYRPYPVPCFCAYLSATAAAVTGNGTTYKLLCDSELIDTTSSYNTATGELTAPISGMYSFYYSTAYLYNATGGRSGASYFNVNGLDFQNESTPTAGNLAGYSGTSGYITLSGSMDVYVAAGQKVYIKIVFYGGQKVDSIVGKGAGSIYYTTFGGYLIN